MILQAPQKVPALCITFSFRLAVHNKTPTSILTDIMASSSSSDNMNADPAHRFPNFSFSGSVNPEMTQRPDDPQFDIFEWYPKYLSCTRYFLDHAQHSMPVQALAAFVNILLPFQRQPHPVQSSFASGTSGLGASAPRAGSFRVQSPSSPGSNASPAVSLIPFLRRLVATGMDFPGVLHGFFGDDWAAGIGSLHEQERRNYLFAAKSGGWASVKRDYDMLPLESVPFLRPLQGAVDAEIEAAERSWSEWLALEDWMLASRSPETFGQRDQTTSSRGEGL